MTSREPAIPDRGNVTIPAPASPTSPESGSARSWVLTSDARPHVYTAVTSIVFELGADPGLGRDSMTISSRFSLSFDRTNSSAQISGNVERYSIEAGSRVGPIAQPSTPIAFSGNIGNGQLSLNTAESTLETTAAPACPNSASTAIAGIRRITFLLPAQISRDMTWMDNTSSTTCHGLTPVDVTLTSTYKVIGDTNHRGLAAILIERTGVISTEGQGSDGQHTVAITGNGSAAGKFYVDRVTGLLLGSEDRQRMKIIIASSGRRQEFSQTVLERVNLDSR